jgi:hypothetical protein
MSLELAIQENTAAINSLIAILSSQPSVTDVQQAQAPVAENNSASNTPEGASIPKADVAAEKSAKSSATVEDEQPATEAVGVTYDDTAKVVQALAVRKGREVAVKVLDQFGAKTLKDVKPSDFAAVIAACEAA